MPSTSSEGSPSAWSSSLSAAAGKDSGRGPTKCARAAFRIFSPLVPRARSPALTEGRVIWPAVSAL
eukprot:5385655-Alexandrium_andersonii.AAC.1